MYHMRDMKNTQQQQQFDGDNIVGLTCYTLLIIFITIEIIGRI